MKIKILEKSKDGNKLVLKIDGASSAYMNTIRRLLMNEVPVMAIDEVEFRKNNSILYDELVAHRLGLIPLSTDLKSYNLPEECKCKGAGCAQCQLKLTLKGKTDKTPITVYAKDIKSKDPKVKPLHPGTPIVKLHARQQIECILTATLGKGKTHGKWSPCLVWFKHYPEIKIKKHPNNASELVKKYPKVLQLKKGKLSVDETSLINHDLIDESVTKESNGAITYKESDDYILYIESWGQLNAKTLIDQAIQQHNAQLKEFKKLLKNIK